MTDTFNADARHKFDKNLVEEFGVNGGNWAPSSPVHNLLGPPTGRRRGGGTEAFDGSVRELPLDERNALWPRVVESAPQFGDYQAKTMRVILLFELTPA